MDLRGWMVGVVESLRNALPAHGPEWLTKPEWLAVWVGVLTLLNLVGVLTPLVVIVQRRIMRSQTRLMAHQDSTMKEQTALMQSQLQIAARQAGIIESQLARRPAPRITLDTSKESAALTRVRITVDNHAGTKGIKEFEWSVWFPLNAIFGETLIVLGRVVGRRSGTTIEGIQYVQFSEIWKLPIYPTIESVVGEGKVLSERLPQKIFWRVVCEDGRFPEGEERGTIELYPVH